MPLVVDYASLSQAITDYSHRSDLATYVDYFIQAAQEQINKDIFDSNFGNGIKLMENAYPPTAIANGIAPVPTDWMAPKLMTVTSGSQTFDLIFKSAAWIYDQYPTRQAVGIPAYIARDLNASGGGSFAQSSVQQLSAATAGQTVYTLTIPSGGAVQAVVLDGSTQYPTTDYTIAGSTLTFVNPLIAGQVPLVQYLAPLVAIAASLTSAFIFGPFPDSAYTIAGTYYAQAPQLSLSNTTNWMVQSCPDLLLAACMLKAQRFIRNANALAMWKDDYKGGLEQLVSADKAERWAAATMQVETA